jgi:pimeloyl-ACP methyl ester carboxylesterase
MPDAWFISGLLNPARCEPITFSQSASLAWSFSAVFASGERLAIGLAGFTLGLVVFILLAVIEYAAWALVAPPRPKVTKDETGGYQDAAAIAEPSTPGPISVLARDGARLAALWHPARGDQATGRTVLLLHGFAEGSDSLQIRRIEALNGAGWNAAALDLRGYGKSEGLFASFGGREADDVTAWLDALSRRLGPKTPPWWVLWGRSMGAAIAILAAARDDRVKGLILESPMVDLDDALAVWFRKRRAPFPHLLARLATRRAGQIAGVSLTRPRPIDSASQVRCPVLMIHGTDDRLIPDAEARRLAEAFPAPARWIEIPGAGHADVVDVGGEDLLAKINHFLTDAVNERSS